MTKFTFKRKLPIWKLILGFMALIVGVISLFSSFKGFILIGMGIFILLVEGSEFDFKNQKYREIKSILGISIGKWKPIPNIEYVSVFRTNETTTLRSRTAEANVSNEIIKLNLFYNTNQKIEAYNTYNIDDAFKKAKEIASILNIDILDATERESKWL
ncbi:hypothetical protein FBALC1_01242 [Flavobacteriales bacterium ALC-1]|nr:hypothetical protein FBALC1_01242 [Flavobacteriales bacterium ALC-1]